MSRSKFVMQVEKANDLPRNTHGTTIKFKNKNKHIKKKTNKKLIKRPTTKEQREGDA